MHLSYGKGRQLCLCSAAMNEKSENEASESFGFREVPKTQKAGMVREVFNKVADRYDLMNDAMSFGIHRLWKDMVITRANPQPGEILLDVAGGTGDLSRLFLKKAANVAKRRGVDKQARVIVSDINAEMLLAGIKDSDPQTMTRLCANAENLPLETASVDVVTISFGIRNVTDKPKALREMLRVLKPGGRFLCLEFSKPVSKALEAPYDLWSFHGIPKLGELLVNDRDSYQYLVESIRRFPDQESFAAMIREAGFARVSYRNFSGGVAALHTGWKL